MTLGAGEYKIITQPEKSIIVNKEKKEAELAALEDSLKNVSISQEDIDAFVAQETEEREQAIVKRIIKAKNILEKING